jgi:hypothetical protein
VQQNHQTQSDNVLARIALLTGVVFHVCLAPGYLLPRPSKSLFANVCNSKYLKNPSQQVETLKSEKYFVASK